MASPPLSPSNSTTPPVPPATLANLTPRSNARVVRELSGGVERWRWPDSLVDGGFVMFNHPIPQRFTRRAAIEHKVLVPRRNYQPCANCYSCGRVVVLHNVNDVEDVGCVNGVCSKCGGTIGRIYGLVNLFPREHANDAPEERPGGYRINPFFIAVFSDDMGDEVHPYPRNVNYQTSQQLYDRFKGRFMDVEQISVEAEPKGKWEFIAECPFIEDPTRYHGWRRIAMGDWEDLNHGQIIKIVESARVAMRLEQLYIDKNLRNRW